MRECSINTPILYLILNEDAMFYLRRRNILYDSIKRDNFSENYLCFSCVDIHHFVYDLMRFFGGIVNNNIEIPSYGFIITYSHSSFSLYRPYYYFVKTPDDIENGLDHMEYNNFTADRIELREYILDGVHYQALHFVLACYLRDMNINKGILKKHDKNIALSLDVMPVLDYSYDNTTGSIDFILPMRGLYGIRYNDVIIGNDITINDSLYFERYLSPID